MGITSACLFAILGATVHAKAGFWIVYGFGCALSFFGWLGKDSG